MRNGQHKALLARAFKWYWHKYFCYW